VDGKRVAKKGDLEPSAALRVGEKGGVLKKKAIN